MINAPSSMIAGDGPPPSAGPLKSDGEHGGDLPGRAVRAGRTMPSSLSDHAPSRTVGPRDLPSPAVVRAVLAQEGGDYWGSLRPSTR